MSWQLQPWRTAARSLAVRTRPLRSAAHHQHQHLPSRIAVAAGEGGGGVGGVGGRVSLLTRRSFADDATSNNNTNNRGPTNPEEDVYAQFGQQQQQQQPSMPTQEQLLQQRVERFAPNFLNAEALEALEREAEGVLPEGALPEGLLFPMPARPQKGQQLQDRQSPVIDLVTKFLMRDGKKSQAQRHVSLILNYLRTAPPPRPSPLRPLLPGSPPANQLPLDPVLYMTLAIDSVAPLLRIRPLRGQAGGGRALELPEPLPARARRRVALGWISSVVARKRSMGSGRTQFAARFAQELVAVVEGRSAVWDRRAALHKMATQARANLGHRMARGGRR
ncbi:ribosomal protein S7 domain-containing protein [Xylariaceae sp. FL0804]|nr:ribosomal protein S7 domain-containing protein [Xylariaceae sp. FL0804]